MKRRKRRNEPAGEKETRWRIWNLSQTDRQTYGQTENV